jgi:hypothetical protein
MERGVSEAREISLRNGAKRSRSAPSRTASIARRGLSWLPWQSLVGRVARGYGFIDPATVLQRLRRFAKPSDVGEPIELLRAGVVFHARGLINTRAIQFNLDWVWPYWVEQQFNPNSDSFIPRAFSFSHINLTHRNWTAVGLPDLPHYPIVDPRGLITPLFDGWSLDFWLLPDGQALLPSKCPHAEQSIGTGKNLSVRTRVADGQLAINSEVSMEEDERGPCCVIRVQASGGSNGHLVVAARPYNPEGVSFIDSIQTTSDDRGWLINGHDRVEFSHAPDRTAVACYETGDVFHALEAEPARKEIECPVGMATAAALFPSKAIDIRIPIATSSQHTSWRKPDTDPWREEVDTCARLQIPDERLQRLYDIAVRTVILHSPGEVFPGPYTYKRFWYRDAALILNSLITLGAAERTGRALDLFPRGQLRDGYFRSQDGEWDSNGQVLWIMHRYIALSGEDLPAEWIPIIERGARWIVGKRMGAASAHPGLLPAGFSAEHLGPNDFYYWDDFWGVAGLRAAAELLNASNPAAAGEFRSAADDFMGTILRSVDRALPRTGGAIPAAPDRRMDSGAVGSLVADFPLHLLPVGDPRALKCVEWLLANSFVRGGFFQNMIHSGINAYLTLHVAQVLLRAGDQRAHQLIDAVAALASPTGQWPEAIHPRTLGGCMGDGQHVWAAAEWILMMRNLFVREESGTLVIGSGIRPEWLEGRKPVSIENTLTPYGNVSIRLEPDASGAVRLRIDATWRGARPRLDIRIPDRVAHPVDEQTYLLRKQD